MTDYARTNWPMAYMITYTTYGTWVHGNKSGSIRKQKPLQEKALLGPNKNLEIFEKSMLKGQPFLMDAEQRQLILDAILDVCKFRNWQAYAVHVRKNHIHTVVSAKTTPEKVMNDFKVYATRALRKHAVKSLPAKLWTRHGSTRYLWSREQLSVAVNYVSNAQGKMMAFGQTKKLK